MSMDGPQRIDAGMNRLGDLIGCPLNHHNVSFLHVLEWNADMRN